MVEAISRDFKSNLDGLCVGDQLDPKSFEILRKFEETNNPKHWEWTKNWLTFKSFDQKTIPKAAILRKFHEELPALLQITVIPELKQAIFDS